MPELEIISTDPFGLKHVRKIKGSAMESFPFLLGRKLITIKKLAFDLSMVSANGATVTGDQTGWTVNQDDVPQEIQEHRLGTWKELEEDESLELRLDRRPTWKFIASQWLHRRPVYTNIIVRQRS